MMGQLLGVLGLHSVGKKDVAIYCVLVIRLLAHMDPGNATRWCGHNNKEKL